MRNFIVEILNQGLIATSQRAHPNWKGSLNSWRKIVLNAKWRHFADVRQTLKNADQVGDCVVFNIAHNEARLISFIKYEDQTVTVLGILTHKEYDKGGWKSACNC